MKILIRKFFLNFLVKNVIKKLLVSNLMKFREEIVCLIFHKEHLKMKVSLKLVNTLDIT